MKSTCLLCWCFPWFANSLVIQLPTDPLQLSYWVETLKIKKIWGIFCWTCRDIFLNSLHKKCIVAPLSGPNCWVSVPIAAVWADCQPDRLQCKTAWPGLAPLEHREDLCTSEALAPSSSPGISCPGPLETQPGPRSRQPLQWGRLTFPKETQACYHSATLSGAERDDFPRQALLCHRNQCY